MNNLYINVLKNGGVGVLPTDTLYGLVGSAFSKKAVARLYALKKRNPKKPFVVLIAAVSDLKRFGVAVPGRHEDFLRRVWPGPVSVILPCKRNSFQYLHRGSGAIAFRLPKSVRLRRLIQKTGPLVAPSANPEGKEPARTIREARAYFGARVDFYLDGGALFGEPSTLVKILR